VATAEAGAGAIQPPREAADRSGIGWLALDWGFGRGLEFDDPFGHVGEFLFQVSPVLLHEAETILTGGGGVIAARAVMVVPHHLASHASAHHSGWGSISHFIDFLLRIAPKTWRFVR